MFSVLSHQTAIPDSVPVSVPVSVIVSVPASVPVPDSVLSQASVPVSLLDSACISVPLSAPISVEVAVPARTQDSVKSDLTQGSNGLAMALASIFPDAKHRHCRVHLIRNFRGYLSECNADQIRDAELLCSTIAVRLVL